MKCRQTPINLPLAATFFAGITLPAKADNPVAKEPQNKTATASESYQVQSDHHFYGAGFGARHFGGAFYR